MKNKAAAALAALIFLFSGFTGGFFFGRNTRMETVQITKNVSLAVPGETVVVMKEVLVTLPPETSVPPVSTDPIQTFPSGISDATEPMQITPETTTPAQITPESTIPTEMTEGTVPPPETEPKTTMPDETTPVSPNTPETVPEDTKAPETTQPVQTIPETTTPKETVSETTTPKETIPKSTQPKEPTPSEQGISYPVNINTATKQQLDTLPGIGEVLSQRIIDYRNANGPFRSVDDLLKIKGIGEKTLAKLKPYATI